MGFAGLPGSGARARGLFLYFSFYFLGTLKGYLESEIKKDGAAGKSGAGADPHPMITALSPYVYGTRRLLFVAEGDLAMSLSAIKTTIGASTRFS